MDRSSVYSYYYYYSQRRLSGVFRAFFFLPTGLALLTSFSILLYTYSTSTLFTPFHHIAARVKSPSAFSTPNFFPIVLNNASDRTKSQALEEGARQELGSQRGPGPPLISNGT